MARTSIKSKSSKKSKTKSKSSSKSSKKAAKRSFGRNKIAAVAGTNNPNTDVVSNIPIASAFQLLASPSPFAVKCTRVLTWRGDPYYATGGLVSNYLTLAVNNAFDPDYNNVFGNGQPLYWDQLTSATGPYRSYVVKRWTVTWQLINGAAYEMEVLVDNSLVAADDDTIAEIRSRPTPTRVLLAANGAGGHRVDLVHSGTAKEYVGFTKDTTQVTAYNASPGQIIYQTIFWQNMRSNASYNLIICPTIVMEIDFSNTDSTAS